jgi:hypothetical protein
MASTRFHDDDARIQKSLQQSTDQGRWMLNVPGNGAIPDYMADPHIRAQKWGGNLRTNAVDLETALHGGNRRLGSDTLGDIYEKYTPSSTAIAAPVNSTLFTEQSRAVAPAWMVRDSEKREQWQYLMHDPQLGANVHIPFKTNVNTRTAEKDAFVAKRDCTQMYNTPT